MSLWGSTACWALPDGIFDEESLVVPVINAGCSPEAVKVREVYLRSPAGESADRLLYCQDDCGIGGCNYFIFLRLPEVAGLYQYGGNFTGNFKILRSVHDGYFDLRVEQRMGAEKKLEETLRCKSHHYR